VTLLCNLRITVYRLYRKDYSLTHATTGILGMLAASSVIIKIWIEREIKKSSKSSDRKPLKKGP